PAERDARPGGLRPLHLERHLHARLAALGAAPREEHAEQREYARGCEPTGARLEVAHERATRQREGERLTRAAGRAGTAKPDGACGGPHSVTPRVSMNASGAPAAMCRAGVRERTP